MWKKVISLVSLGVVLVFALWAGGSTEQAGDQPTTISYWFQGNVADETDLRLAWQQKNIETFMAANPTITVEVTLSSDADEFLNKLNTSMAAGTGPDMYNGWLSGRLEPYVEAGRIMPLDDVINDNSDIARVTKREFLDTATFDGSVYGIPQLLTAEVVFYNKAIFRDAGVAVPTTFEELLDVIGTLRSAGVTPFALGNKLPWPGAIHYFAIFDRLNGPDLYEDVVLNHTSKWTDPAFEKAAVQLLRLVDAGAYPENFNSIHPAEGRAMFMAGEAAMRFIGTWELGALVQELGDDLGFFNFPEIEGGGGSLSGWILNKDSGYMITQKDEDREACVEFLRHILSNDRQRELAEMGFLIAPINIEYDESKVAPITNELMKVFATAEYSIIPWDNPLGSTMGIEFNNAVKAILSGSDPAETFERLQVTSLDEWGQ